MYKDNRVMVEIWEERWRRMDKKRSEIPIYKLFMKVFVSLKMKKAGGPIGFLNKIIKHSMKGLLKIYIKLSEY